MVSGPSVERLPMAKGYRMTIVIEPDVIELPDVEEEDVDPDDLEYEDPPVYPAKPNWDV